MLAAQASLSTSSTQRRFGCTGIAGTTRAAWSPNTGPSPGALAVRPSISTATSLAVLPTLRSSGGVGAFDFTHAGVSLALSPLTSSASGPTGRIGTDEREGRGGSAAGGAAGAAGA